MSVCKIVLHKSGCIAFNTTRNQLGNLQTIVNCIKNLCQVYQIYTHINIHAWDLLPNSAYLIENTEKSFFWNSCQRFFKKKFKFDYTRFFERHFANGVISLSIISKISLFNLNFKNLNFKWTLKKHLLKYLTKISRYRKIICSKNSEVIALLECQSISSWIRYVYNLSLS